MRVLPFILLLLPAPALAQLEIDPSEPPAEPEPGPPPNPYLPSTGTSISGRPERAGTSTQGTGPPQVRTQGQAGDVEGQPAVEEGIYLGGGSPSSGEVPRYDGELPEVHVVQKGDTLWDICSYYFGDSLKWPEIWGLNPAITNPHWIYPGDLVRLLLGHAVAVQPTETPTETPVEPTPAPAPAAARSPSGVELRQLAFVTTEDMTASSKVTGSTDEKLMLSARDQVYLEYPEGHPPQVGARYSIYAPKKAIKHPSTNALIGHYVIVKGELQVLEVKKDKRALAVITQVNPFGVVERGERVGPLKTQLRMVEPVAPDRSLEGIIVGIIEVEELIGEWQAVFVDRGAEDGVKVGNRMLVVRRGDEYPGKRKLTAGQDDRRYPDHYVGTLIIVDAGKRTSLGLMTRSDRELHVSDHVLMRKP